MNFAEVPKTFPEISVVVVTWNVKDALRECLMSINLQADAPFELIVIDNGSADGTPDLLKSLDIANPLCQRFEVILNPDDLGYSTAANQGIRESSAPNVLLLNPDTVITPGTLAALLATAAKYPRLGVLGVRILNSDGTPQSSVSDLPTLRGQLELRLGLHKSAGYHRLFRRPLPEKFDYTKEAIIPQIKGAVAFITQAALSRVGLWDDGFFLWFEDTDFCQRVRDAGLEVRYTPEVTVYHQSQAGLTKMPFLERQAIWNRSIRRYFRKHHGAIQGAAIGVLDPLCMFIGMGLKKIGFRF